MSEARWELLITPTVAETYEAIVLAGKVLLQRRDRAVLAAQGIFIGLCAPIGATMNVWLLVMFAGGPEFSELPTGAFPATFVAFLLLTIWFSRQAYFIAAHASVRSCFGRSQNAVLEQGGVTLTTDNSSWQTGWADVETVRGGKKTLIIGVSGIAIVLPRRVFLGPQDADDALLKMQQWQQDAQ